MRIQQVVKELEQVAEQLGFKVRMEKGSFRGGRCMVEEERQIVLNRRHPPEVHLSILAESLRDQPVDGVYMKPAVRNALEEKWRLQNEKEADIETVDIVPE